jgi:hypothetical protein
MRQPTGYNRHYFGSTLALTTAGEIMKSFRFTRLFVLAALLALAANVVPAQTSTITYQGRLTDGGTPANGTYDLQFTLWDAVTTGNQIPVGSPIVLTKSGVSVTNGVFTVQLDFTAAAFPGADRFLDISVKHPLDSSYTPLLPRQQLTSTPYAIRALSTTSADTAISATTATTATNNVLKSGDTMTGALLLSGDPAVGLGAATKQYVDAGDALKLNLSGGTMTGALNLPSLALTGNGVITAPRVENSASDPAAASAVNSGRLYFNTGSKALKFSDGAAWQSVVTLNLATSTSGATPSVVNLTVLVLNYSTPTTITDLTGGADGQCVVLINAGAASSAPISNGGNFKLNSNWPAASDDTLTVCRYNGFWYETARKNPSVPIIIPF